MPVHGGSGTPAQDRNLEEKLLFAKPQSANKLLRAKRSGLDWKAGEGTPPPTSALHGRGGGGHPRAAALTGTPGEEGRGSEVAPPSDSRPRSEFPQPPSQTDAFTDEALNPT